MTIRKNRVKRGETQGGEGGDSGEGTYLIPASLLSNKKIKVPETDRRGTPRRPHQKSKWFVGGHVCQGTKIPTKGRKK